MSDWIPVPDASQNPIPNRRSINFTDALMQSRHAGAERMAERGYTPQQVYQTAAYGQRYPDRHGQPDISLFQLNSIDTPGTQRQIVVDTARQRIVTVLPRKPIESSPPGDRRPASPRNTKKRQKEQRAKKRARSGGSES